MNIASMLALWRRELSDAKTTLYPNGKRFTDELMLAWLTQSRLLVYKYRPQWYQKTVVLKLKPGSLQNICDCNLMYTIDGLSDANGNILSPLTKQSKKAEPFFGKADKCAPCVPAGSPLGTTPVVLPTDYQFDPNIPGRFIVNPPVPATGDYYVRAVCANPPKTCCDPTDPDCCLSIDEYPIVGFYVKAMAHGMQKESAISQNLYTQNMKMFYELLGVHKKADKEFLQQTKAA